MSPLEGVFGRKENLVQVKLFVQVTHKHMSIMSQEQRLGKWLMFKGIHLGLWKPYYHEVITLDLIGQAQFQP